MIEQWDLLAAVIAAHPNREVVGRTRLQKTVKLLQRLGLPTSFAYMIHFYGPYSEALHATIPLLEHFGLANEEERKSGTGESYYVERACPAAKPELVADWQPAINILAEADLISLELAATYDAFREQGDPHPEALKRLRRKKGEKCDNGNEDKALELLGSLGLPVAG